MVRRNPIKMNESHARECVIGKFKRLYASDMGGKQFMHHLVNAFSERNIRYKFTQNEGEELVDCVTNQILSPLYEVMPKGKLDFSKIKSEVKFDTAIGSKVSDKYLGKVELDELKKWIQDQITAGNKKVIKIVKYNSYSKPKKVRSTRNYTRSFTPRKFNPSKSIGSDERIKNVLDKAKKELQ